MQLSSVLRVSSLLGVMFAASACTHRPAADVGPLLPAPQYQLTKTMPIGGEGRWDYIAFEPTAGLLYVTRQSHVQVVEPASGKVVADIPNLGGVHGVAFAQEFSRGFISDGKTDSVVVFDLKTWKIIGSVPVGQKPDAIVYDPASKKVYCFNAKSEDATVIDPAAVPDKANIATIPLGTGPESCVADGRGHVFVDLEDGNAVAVIDTATMKVTATYPTSGGEGPAGLAIDPIRHVLFAGCHNQVMSILDSGTGKPLATLPIGAGVDYCSFDAATGEAFASCGDGTVTGIRRTVSDKYEVTQTIHTKAGARTMTIDPGTHVLYLPTAEFLPKAEGEHWPQMKPGTFMILVMSPK